MTSWQCGLATATQHKKDVASLPTEQRLLCGQSLPGHPIPVAFFPGSLKGVLRGRAGSRGLLAPILAFAPLSGMCKFASPWNSLLCMWRVLGGDVPAPQGSTQGRAGTIRRPSPSEPEQGRTPDLAAIVCVQENRADLGALGPWLLAAVSKCERWESADVFRVVI